MYCWLLLQIYPWYYDWFCGPGSQITKTEEFFLDKNYIDRLKITKTVMKMNKNDLLIKTTY